MSGNISDTELRKLLTDFQKKYPNSKAILSAGVEHADYDLIKIAGRMDDYHGEHKTEFREQISILSDMIDQAFEQKRIKQLSEDLQEYDESIKLEEYPTEMSNSARLGGDKSKAGLSEIFAELDELLDETSQEINPEPISEKESMEKTEQREQKESRVEQDIEDHISYVESIDPKYIAEIVSSLNVELIAYNENKLTRSEMQHVNDQMEIVGFRNAILKLNGDAKVAVSHKDLREIENLEMKVSELQGQLERSREDNSSKSESSSYRKVMASILDTAIQDLTRVKNFLGATRKELLDQAQNKRPATQVLEEGPIKKSRREAGVQSKSQDINIIIPKIKIENGISNFIEPHSIPVDISRNVHQYNQAREQISRVDPSSNDFKIVEKKLNDSRDSICSALGFYNELAVLETLVNNSGVRENKVNAKKLYEAASDLAKVLEDQVGKLEEKQQTYDYLGQKSPRLDAAVDAIDISLIKLDQLKSRLVEHLPAKDREQIERKSFDFGDKK